MITAQQREMWRDDAMRSDLVNSGVFLKVLDALEKAEAELDQLELCSACATSIGWGTSNYGPVTIVGKQE